MNNEMTDLRRRYNSLIDKHQTDVTHMLNDITRYKEDNSALRSRLSHLEHVLAKIGKKLNMRSDSSRPWADQLLCRIDRLQQDGAEAVRQLASTTNKANRLQNEKDQLARELEQKQ